MNNSGSGALASEGSGRLALPIEVQCLDRLILIMIGPKHQSIGNWNLTREAPTFS